MEAEKPIEVFEVDNQVEGLYFDDVIATYQAIETGTHNWSHILRASEDEELKEYVQSIPLRKHFTQLESEFIVPMNVGGVWTNFFEPNSDGTYSMDKALLDLNEVFHDEGTW